MESIKEEIAKARESKNENNNKPANKKNSSDELLLFISYETAFENVLLGILIPLFFAGFSASISAKKDCYILAADIEKELLDIFKYIKLFDELKENEQYILNYISTNKEKYYKNNKFDVNKAKGVI